MTYTITKNAQFNSLEIAFDGKPAEEIREALKALRFRWNGAKKVWYGYAEEAAAREAIEGKATEEKKPAAKKTAAPKLDKDMIRSEYAKVWRDEKMVSYCVDKVATVAILPNGDIIPVEKRRIETRFCFGESGYDYDEAQRAAAHARKSESNFKRENMKDLREKVEMLRDYVNAPAGKSNYCLYINDKTYIGQADDCRIRSVSFVKWWEVIDACGGSCYLSELPGQHLNIDRLSGRIATKEEAAVILKAYEAAEAAHEKKVDSYLKRYGMKNVRAWTYWIDA